MDTSRYGDGHGRNVTLPMLGTATRLSHDACGAEKRLGRDDTRQRRLDRAREEHGAKGGREGDDGMVKGEPALALVARARVPDPRAAHQEKREGGGSEKLQPGRKSGGALRPERDA